jgi:hypothetical protein
METKHLWILLVKVSRSFWEDLRKFSFGNNRLVKVSDIFFLGGNIGLWFG